MAGIVDRLHRAYGRFRRRIALRGSGRLTRAADRSVRVLWQSPEAAGREICYFSSFDRDGVVDAYVWHYLRELRRTGFDVVFVSTSPSVRPSDLDRLRTAASVVVHRENLGYDFYSWKTGLGVFPPRRDTERVLLANDSVYGPVEPLDDYIARMESSPWDAVGLTDSWEIEHHVQSYFLYCKKSLIDGGFLSRFFGAMNVVSTPRAVIRRYEVGFTRAVREEGFAIGALVDYRHAVEQYAAESTTGESWHRENPTISLWRELLAHSRSPFIKRKIFRLNPEDTASALTFVGDVLRDRKSALTIDVIRNNLTRLGDSS